MAILDVTKIGDSILKTKAKKVADLGSDRVRKIAINMIDTMHAKEGIGIAAPQIGISERVIIINAEDGPLALVNPLITSHSFRKESGEEGCLSIPGVYGLVARYKKVRVTAFNIKGKKILINGDGLLARVLQHEIDHIDGILFIDRAKKFIRGKDLLPPN